MKSIKLTEEQFGSLESIHSKINDAEAGVQLGFSLYRERHEKLNKALKEMFPDEKTVSINWEKKTVTFE